MDCQPIETAPKNGTPICVYGIRSGSSRELGMRWHAPAKWDGFVWRMLDRPGGFIGMTVDATHWKPLPQPSEGEGMLENLNHHQISWLRFTLADELKKLDDMSFINADTVHDALVKANDKMIPYAKNIYQPKEQNNDTE